MKRGSIYDRIFTSVRRTASIRFSHEFFRTALSSWCLIAGRHFSGAFLIQSLSRVLARVTLQRPTARYVPFGLPQSSFAISSWQVLPVNAFYNARACVGGDRSKMNESAFATCSVPDKFVLLYGRLMAPRAIGRGKGAEVVVSELEREPLLSTSRLRPLRHSRVRWPKAAVMAVDSEAAVTELPAKVPHEKRDAATRRSVHSAAVPIRISTHSVARQLPLFGGRHRRSKGPNVSADPYIIGKVCEIVGRYLSMLSNALTQCVGETSLGRTSSVYGRRLTAGRYSHVERRFDLFRQQGMRLGLFGSTRQLMAGARRDIERRDQHERSLGGAKIYVAVRWVAS
ncbi:hypothetical protein [Burkholderia pyrrocinia]|uniref:hypothetical protein n=1 Tax=Burkholderia pyrrocinia TaxID=60550 RepID=UPI001BCEBBF8|nr:hypothetical protein [Burkholderia pyrrocinia]QVN16763.1 hypothetical protein JYG32_10715 [Burkholderia pyrrocinia]